MKTITVNLYKFSELSEEAKQTAIQEHRSKEQDYSFYTDEIVSSAEKVIELFDLKTGNRYSDIRTSHSRAGNCFASHPLTNRLADLSPWV